MKLPLLYLDLSLHTFFDMSSIIYISSTVTLKYTYFSINSINVMNSKR